jgi:hypothetical protein
LRARVDLGNLPVEGRRDERFVLGPDEVLGFGLVFGFEAFPRSGFTVLGVKGAVCAVIKAVFALRLREPLGCAETLPDPTKTR